MFSLTFMFKCFVWTEMSHLCLFTSSVPFFMLPSRFVRSCSHDGDGELDDDDDSNHLNKKLLYEILCYGVDVSRPVNLSAVSWLWSLSWWWWQFRYNVSQFCICSILIFVRGFYTWESFHRFQKDCRQKMGGSQPASHRGGSQVPTWRVYFDWFI